MGGSRGGTSVSSTLRRHIETCKNKYPTIEELVDHLRTNYPHYSRQKLQPFTRSVKRMIDIINSKNSQTSKISHRTTATTTTTTSSFLMDIDEEGGVVRDDRQSRKAIDLDQSEENLEQLERRHIRKRQKIFVQEQGSSVSSESETSSSEEQQDGTVSTSEDAKVEPKFDLVKSMLRATYSASKDSVKSKRKEATVEKSVEMEDGWSSKTAMKIDLLGGKSNLGKIEEKGKSLVDYQQGQVGKRGPRLSDLGGMSSILEGLRENVLFPIYNKLPYKMIVASPHDELRKISGILLHGPPGCGKTRLADALASESGLPYYKVSASELVSGVSGGSEENIRNLFAKAYRTAPSIVFIDEIDAIASKRENSQSEMSKRIVTQLMTCMDVSHRPVQPDAASSADISSSEECYVLVIGATNIPGNIDTALRRPGRFDLEIPMGVPDEEARLEILKTVARRFKLEYSFDPLKIARSTPGFVGGDLEFLVTQAGRLAINKLKFKIKAEFQKEGDGVCPEDWWKIPWIPKEGETLAISMADLEEAAKEVQASSIREGFTSIPNVKWEDVGGMESVREEFQKSIISRIMFPEDFELFNVDIEKGFLLYGPPGVGKTLIAKAVANEAGANFIFVKAGELLNKYVGETEKSILSLFRRARTCSPCIIFFDEVDALTTKRENESGGYVVDSLLNQLLIELDGADDRSGVYVIAATNRPERISSALLRSGRLGKHLYVRLPSPDDRGLILKALARNKPIDPSVDLLEIGKLTACDNYSGADLRSLVNEAAYAALVENRRVSNLSTIHRRHFDIAFQKVHPNASEKDIQFYDNWASGKMR